MNHDANGPPIEFAELRPALDRHVHLYMLEGFTASVRLRSARHRPEDLRVELWTNALHKHSSEGEWRPVELSLQSHEGDATYRFEGSFLATGQGEFQYTYRAGLRQGPARWRWAGGFGENGRLRVAPPAAEETWAQGPRYVEILDGVYVGNFIAASQAEEHGFDAVLNLAEEFSHQFPPGGRIAYKKIGLPDGAENPISAEAIAAGVRWIEEQRARGRGRVLVHCRAGIGRSGSMGVAFCFHRNRGWTYDQTLEYVWSRKPDIYPHRCLQETLERLYPRAGGHGTHDQGAHPGHRPVTGVRGRP